MIKKLISNYKNEYYSLKTNFPKKYKLMLLRNWSLRAAFLFGVIWLIAFILTFVFKVSAADNNQRGIDASYDLNVFATDEGFVATAIDVIYRMNVDSDRMVLMYNSNSQNYYYVNSGDLLDFIQYKLSLAPGQKEKEFYSSGLVSGQINSLNVVDGFIRFSDAAYNTNHYYGDVYKCQYQDNTKYWMYFIGEDGRTYFAQTDKNFRLDYSYVNLYDYTAGAYKTYNCPEFTNYQNGAINLYYFDAYAKYWYQTDDVQSLKVCHWIFGSRIYRAHGDIMIANNAGSVLGEYPRFTYLGYQLFDIPADPTPTPSPSPTVPPSTDDNFNSVFESCNLLFVRRLVNYSGIAYPTYMQRLVPDGSDYKFSVSLSTNNITINFYKSYNYGLQRYLRSDPSIYWSSVSGYGTGISGSGSYPVDNYTITFEGVVYPFDGWIVYYAPELAYAIPESNSQYEFRPISEFVPYLNTAWNLTPTYSPDPLQPSPTAIPSITLTPIPTPTYTVNLPIQYTGLDTSSADGFFLSQSFNTDGLRTVGGFIPPEVKNIFGITVLCIIIGAFVIYFKNYD